MKYGHSGFDYARPKLTGFISNNQHWYPAMIKVLSLGLQEV